MMYINELPSVIDWRLNELMAKYDIKGVDLAAKLQISTNAVSRMRRAKDMPGFSGKRLGQLCDALNDLIKESGQNAIITPAELLSYTYSDAV